MNLLQCMILFTVIFAGQVVAREYTFGGSDPIRTRAKEKQIILSPREKKNAEEICLYVDKNLDIFHQYYNQVYKVLNFAIHSNLFQMPVNEKDLLPIYYGKRLGLILEKVQDQPGTANSQTTSPKPATQPNSGAPSTKPPAPAKQYLLAFQRTAPNAKGLYEFDYLPLSQKNLADLIRASQNPENVTEVRASNDKSGPAKFVFTIKSFKNRLNGTYYLSLELDPTQFLPISPTPPASTN